MIARHFLKLIRPSAAIAAVLLLASCANRETPEFLAKVGDRLITAEDLQKEAGHRRRNGEPVPGRELLLREMVQFEALIQRARKTGLADDPAVQREIGLVLISELRERELDKQWESLRVSTNETRAEYERNLAEYSEPAKARAAVLFLECNPKATAAKRGDVRARLEEARRRALENPAPGGRGAAASGFGALAIQFSDDQASRYRGGDIGWLDAGNFEYRWPRPVLEAAYELKKGGISEVLEAEGGFYLVMKTDERPASVTPYARVEAVLRHSLLLKKRRELEEAFRQETIRLAGVQMNEKALAAVELSPGSAEAKRLLASEPPSFQFPNQPAEEH